MPTKFEMVDSILPLKHNGKFTIRMSMNLVENWKELYTELIQRLNSELSERVKKEAFFEIIFMTYSYVHTKINEEAFPTAINLYNRQIMTGRGKGKYSINFNIPILEHILLHVLLTLEYIHFQCLNHINSFQFLHILLA